MASNLTVSGNKEIVLVAENIAHEKGISPQEVIDAMAEGIKAAARKKYGQNLAIDCQIDRKSGQIKLFNSLKVVENNIEDFDPKLHITLSEAKKKNKDANVDDEVAQELPPIDLNRVVAQVARNEIFKKVKEAEKNKEYNEFKDRIGDIVSAAVRKIGVKNIVMEVDGYEAVIHESGLILKEKLKVGDRVRVYIEDVKKEPFGAQIFLSRTHPQFLVKLFEQEVPELYEGNIEVKAVVRDAGSRAKIAIYSRRDDIDIIGSFIGIRGSRVQAVSSELKGEKIDIIKWSPNIAEFVINALTPAKINKVIVDEENNLIEVVVVENQLSLAIGRGGQNVKLASKLVGFKIDVITDEEESSRRTAEFNQASKLFMEALDVEDMIANLLASEGFLTIEDIINSETSEIASIEGFDEDVATEIKKRAEEYLQKTA
ncbi:MAG TPA: transcription termination factor NusA [Rickettsiales bacterium]|nr:transcription termination factor NusA [Rickettsiales bacterium]